MLGGAGMAIVYDDAER
ncbi:hypothetical protein [Streptosporangium sp. NPDC001681]